MHTKIRLRSWRKRFEIRPQIREITATSGSNDSINTDVIQETLDCHLNFWKCTMRVEYIAVLRVASLLKTKWRVGQRSTQNTWLLVAYLCTDGFNLEILPRGFVMQSQILINVIIFVAYVLNLPLNTQRPYHRSQPAGKLGLNFGSWQSPDISRSQLYRATIAWTPPTAMYREYTV